jgi:hypothetical protein
VVARSQLSETAEPTEIRNLAERFEALVVVNASILRALPPAAPPASPAAPAHGMIRRVLYTAAFFFFTYTMDSQRTGLSVRAFAAPGPGQIKPTMLPKNAYHEHITDNMAAPASYVEYGGAGLMAVPVIGGGAPAEDSAPSEDQHDEAEDSGEDFVRDGQERLPKKNVIVTCAPC